MNSAALEVGDLAPPFTLPNADGTPVSLSDYVGRTVIVYFYPAAMTPGCTTEACDFSSAKARTEDAGVTVLGISPDPPATLAAFRDKEGLQVTLLSDADRTVLEAYGAFGEKKQYGRTVRGVIRSTFVVGPDGRLAKVWRNVRATGHVARVLSELGLAS